MRKVLLIIIGVGLLARCQLPPPTITPVPDRLWSLEGHASLKVFAGENTGKSKFSFLFRLPDRGRIEVSGLLGKTLYRILVVGEEAYLVVPQKRVYWRAREEEIIEKFLGARVVLSEIIRIMTGTWDKEGAQGQRRPEGWRLRRDSENRVRFGQRGDLWFEIQEFFAKTGFPRRLVFGHSGGGGRLKVLALGLNRPVRQGAFGTDFVKEYASRTWEEIQALIEDAR